MLNALSPSVDRQLAMPTAHIHGNGVYAAPYVVIKW